MRFYESLTLSNANSLSLIASKFNDHLTIKDKLLWEKLLEGFNEKS